MPPSLKRTMRRLFTNVWESAAYRTKSGRAFHGELRHLVFVCRGNVCRSPFAERYMKSLDPEGRLHIESCGLDVTRANSPPPEAVQAGLEFGIDLSTHRSRGLASCNLLQADLVLPMEYKHYQELVAAFPRQRSKIMVLRDFTPWPQRSLCNIDDPFGLHLRQFRRCFHIIKNALDQIAKCQNRG